MGHFWCLRFIYSTTRAPGTISPACGFHLFYIHWVFDYRHWSQGWLWSLQSHQAFAPSRRRVSGERPRPTHSHAVQRDPLPATLTTALSAGSSTDPWLCRLDRWCLERFQGSVSPGHGDRLPDLSLTLSSSEEDIRRKEERNDAVFLSRSLTPSDLGQQQHSQCPVSIFKKRDPPSPFYFFGWKKPARRPWCVEPAAQIQVTSPGCRLVWKTPVGFWVRYSDCRSTSDSAMAVIEYPPIAIYSLKPGTPAVDIPPLRSLLQLGRLRPASRIKRSWQIVWFFLFLEWLSSSPPSQTPSTRSEREGEREQASERPRDRERESKRKITANRSKNTDYPRTSQP